MRGSSVTKDMSWMPWRSTTALLRASCPITHTKPNSFGSDFCRPEDAVDGLPAALRTWPIKMTLRSAFHAHLRSELCLDRISTAYVIAARDRVIVYHPVRGAAAGEARGTYWSRASRQAHRSNACSVPLEAFAPAAAKAVASAAFAAINARRPTARMIGRCLRPARPQAHRAPESSRA